MATKRTFGERLLACYEDLAFLSKDGENSHFHYKFVTEASVKKAVNITLRKNGLWLDRVQTEERGLSDNGIYQALCTVSVTDGDKYAIASGIGGGKDSGDKGPMKANAAALKYALTSLFLIATGDDPEADEKTDKPAAKRKGGKKEEPVHTVDEVLSLIRIAGTLNDVEFLKGPASKLAANARFLEIKEAFKKRKGELS